MSVVVKRDHPAGEMALTVSAFPGKVVIGQGALRGSMAYFELAAEEAALAAAAMGRAAEAAAKMIAATTNKED